jgi:DNA-binding response OmpR family regulator
MGLSEGDAALVLLTGDPGRDRTELALLLRSLPVRTQVLESYDLWEIVGHAPRCALVVIDGDLHDASGSSLCRLLRHRHPRVSVLVRGAALSSNEMTLVAQAGGTVCASTADHDELRCVALSLLGRRGATAARSRSSTG